MLARVNACAVICLEGVIVDVEVGITTGFPKPPIIIVNLPDASVQKSRERALPAIRNTGLVGGGNFPNPGDISLAHRGVLFLLPS